MKRRDWAVITKSLQKLVGVITLMCVESCQFEVYYINKRYRLLLHCHAYAPNFQHTYIHDSEQYG